MNAIFFSLASLSVKIAVLGGIAWAQLYLLRRAPAASRSRLCAMALIAILVLAAGELVAPGWLVKAPLYTLTAVVGAGALQHAAIEPAKGWSYTWLGYLWVGGAALMLLRAAVGRIALVRLQRRSTPIDSVSGVDVRLAEVQTPILVCLRRPVILLPDAASAWTAEQRRMVQTHELTHFRQGDCWTNLLAQIVRAAFWFHPMVWLLTSRLSREQELTCDEAVVATGHSPHDYAAFLLDAVRHLQSGELFACAMAGSGARSLKERFAHLLDPLPRPVLTRRIAVSMALFALVATALVVVRPVWSQSEQKALGSAARRSEIYKVGGLVSSPAVLTKVEPKYTEEARAGKISGVVYLTLTVTAEGTPEDIEVTSGIDPGLDQSAIDAISQWTFQPATREGQAVAVKANVQVNFRLM